MTNQSPKTKNSRDDHKGCIVGIGETRIGRCPGRTSWALTLEAALAAIEDAGLEKSEIDGVLSDAPYSDPTFLYPIELAHRLGIQPTYASEVGLGGASGVAAIAHACAAIDAGQCRAVLFAQGDNRWSRHKSPPPSHGTLNWGYSDFEEPFGLVGAPGAYALGAQRHIHEYGTRPEHFGRVALTMRRHASLNENAQMRSPLAMNDYLQSPLVVDPFRLLDCSLISDYGGAFVVTSRERARDLRWPPVEVRATAQFHGHRFLCQADSLTETGAKQVAGILYDRAGLTAEDIDIAQLYDSFTYSVLVQLEDYGFCKAGASGPFLEERSIAIDGDLPVNTHGGLLSQGHANGIFHITEAVRQLRGAAGQRQVREADTALVTGGGGVLFATHAAMILNKGR